MTLEELKEKIEAFDAYEFETDADAYEELRQMVFSYNSPRMKGINGKYMDHVVTDVLDYEGMQDYLEDMAKKDGPKALRNALRLCFEKWTVDDYFFIGCHDGVINVVCGVTKHYVMNLRKILLAVLESEVEKGGER